MSAQWVCSCGEPWNDRRHRVQMKRDVGNNLWRGSPALLIPHRQWIREKLPNGNQGFVVCGDDGFIRRFDPTNYSDPGRLVLMEWKSSTGDGRPGLDHATDRLLAGVTERGISATLFVQLVNGNCPGPIAHYPTSRTIAIDDDWLPEQPVIAERIYVNGAEVDEDQLIERLSHA